MAAYAEIAWATWRRHRPTVVSIKVRFRFDSKDSACNTFKGWLIDDVVVTR